MNVPRPDYFEPVLSKNFVPRLIMAARSDFLKREAEQAIQDELVKRGEYKHLNDIINDIACDKADGKDQDR